MWRNYLAAALGNLARNPLYSAINVVGLALGMSAALLIALYVRDELTYDRFFPGYRDAYLLTSENFFEHRKVFVSDMTMPDVSAKLKLEFPQIAAVARVMTTYHLPHLRHGQVEAYEPGFDWVDPDLFNVLPMKAVAGNPSTALRAPDGVVLTRSAARKYFGRDAPIGETLLVDPAMDQSWGSVSSTFNTPHPMRVTAVVEDLPSNTNLKGEVFGSGLAPFSKFALYDQTPEQGPFRSMEFTYVRLKPGTAASAVEKGFAAFSARHMPPGALQGLTIVLHLTPIADIHLSPTSQDSMVARGDAKILAALGGIGLLIVVSASINFVTLMTARAGRRATETGIRKAMGARRSDLIVQYLGEAVIYVALAMSLAVVLTELMLPQMNAVLHRTIAFEYLNDATVLFPLVCTTLGLGLLAGAYPALFLSAFRPATVLKGQLVQSSNGGRIRQALVTLQFAIMIGLAVTAATLYRQTTFSLNDRLRVDGTRVLTIDEACSAQTGAAEGAARAFRERVMSLPGIEASVCTSNGAVFNNGDNTPIRVEGRPQTSIQRAEVDFGALEFYGMKPLAGRFFIPGHGGDGRLTQAGSSGNPSVVLNETALRRLGFASPDDAVGRVVTWTRRYFPNPGVTKFAESTGASEIIGVAPDFDLDTRTPVQPLLFYVDPDHTELFSLRLIGRDLPETLAAIDKAWADTGHRMIHRRFLSQKLQEIYATTILQGVAVGLGAGLALVISALGLFGLSAHAAEQRTKEIGVRKAMGASASDIVRLLLWQFSQPVLWANLLAWPVAWWAMTWWLKGFAYHVDLPAWLFLAAGAGAIVIACLTVLTHALIVARATPSNALRYE